MEIREKIQDVIEKSFVFDQPKKSIEIEIYTPLKKEHGDYTAAIRYKKGKPSIDRLEKTIKKIKKSKDYKKFFKDVKFEPPIFVNFFLLDSYFSKKIKDILKKKERFGELDLGKDKKIQVEFISANPTGPLTVANARGGPFGDVLGNVFKKAGFNVEKAYYINDCGKQILALGHSVLKDKEAEYKGEYIDFLSRKVKTKDPLAAGEKAAEIILEKMIKKTVKKLGIEYDEWFSEKSLHQSKDIEKVLDIFKKKGLIYEKEGAIWFKSSSFGDERDRVLIKSDGAKTYLAGDIAYHNYKFKEKKFDKVVNIWGADHFGDAPGLKSGMEALGFKNKLEIIFLQFVTLFEKKKRLKMSKRKGTYITLDELLKDIDKDVIRFFFLEKAANTHLNFDLSLAKEQSEKNPVYYIQYAHARICSILRKADFGGKFSGKLAEAEIDLARRIIRFPEIVKDTFKDYQIQRIPRYAKELAESFHRFYGDCRVMVENEKIRNKRLALILATKIVLKNTLDLMGISAPEKM